MLMMLLRKNLFSEKNRKENFLNARKIKRTIKSGRFKQNGIEYDKNFVYGIN